MTSPAMLQKLMTKVLCGTEDFTGCLLDDVTIFSDTWKCHLKHVREVLEKLRAASLTHNVANCQFCLRSMQILGYTLMDGQITPSDEKIEAILKLAPAKTKKRGQSNTRPSGVLSQPTTTVCRDNVLPHGTAKEKLARKSSVARKTH